MEDKVRVAEDNRPTLLNRRFKILVRIGLILSATVGFYILEANRSLGILSSSNGGGLLAISILDLVLAFLLTILPTLATPIVASSILTTILQIEELLTAPRYELMISYVAPSLFGLVVFDALLITQFVIGMVSFFATRRAQSSVAIFRI